MQQQEISELSVENLESSIKTFRIENIIGYVLFIVVIGWAVVLPLSSRTLDSPLNPIQVFIHWPSLLVVIGGTIALVLFIGSTSIGQSFTLGFSLTGLIGSLMGLVQVFFSMASEVPPGPISSGNIPGRPLPFLTIYPLTL